MAAHLPRESATVRAQLGDAWWVTPEVEFMREVEYVTRVNTWLQTNDGAKGINPPKRHPLPIDEPDDSDVIGSDEGFDSIEEMDAWFAARRAAA